MTEPAEEASQRRSQAQLLRSIAWRTGVIAFIVLSFVVILITGIAAMFDGEQGAASIAGRFVAGLLVGMVLALLASPVTAVISALAGAAAAAISQRKRARAAA